MILSAIVDPWPPSSGGTGSYAGSDPLTAGLERAVVKSAVVREEGIFLTVSDGSRESSVYFPVGDLDLRLKIADSLAAQKGRNLEQEGLAEV
jgi:hypothetical protein